MNLCVQGFCVCKMREDRRNPCRWPVLLLAMWIFGTAIAINRPVYKVILNQKGFTQFIQYDVETPPIREFTFCTWIMAYNFQNEQSIFTYIVKGNKRVVRLWVDSGGRQLRLLFDERDVAGVPVELGLNTWRHVCLSFQADFGAWALYLDSRLIACESSQALQFFVIPGGGSVILGYGTSEEGSPTGFEGEIFGANMILSSTIGRNYTIQNHPRHIQKAFTKNKIQASKNIDYVVLKNLDADESPNIAQETKLPVKFNTSSSFIRVQTPHSFIEQDIGRPHSLLRPTTQSFGTSTTTTPPHESDVLDLVIKQNARTGIRNNGNVSNLDQNLSKTDFSAPNILNKQTNNINKQTVVLKNFDADEPPNIAQETKLPVKFNTSNSFIRVQTPHSFIEHNTGRQHSLPISTTQSFGTSTAASHESDILDLVIKQNIRTGIRNNGNVSNFGRNMSKTDFSAHNIINKQTNNIKKQMNFETKEIPMLSEFETPPLPNSEKTDYSMEKNVHAKKIIFHPESTFKVENVPIEPLNKNKYNEKSYQYDLPDKVVPPPREMGAKVYGQWTSSKYAGSVLNYLKSINYYNKDKKVPPTIPLIKLSDHFPYASNLNTRLIRPPTNLQKKIILTDKIYQPASGTYRHLEKREVKLPQINVKIIKTDIRSEILKSHASTQPVHVEIINRGDSQKRLIRNSDSKREFEGNEYYPDEHNLLKANNDLPDITSMFNVLPFLKSIEYFTGESESLVKASEDMYSKSLSPSNKWHNIKSYNRNYTPRRVPAVDNNNSNLDQKVSEADKKPPSIFLKYKPDSNKFIHEKNEESMTKGRQLAKDVSKQSENNNDQISILKYNHGFLPGHITGKITNTKSLLRDAELRSKAEFHKHVKIGNALNERKVIGNNDEQKKQSFIGGDEKVPDINRYRSDIDNVKHNVPPSLRPNVCRNVELLDHLLYVHPDGSIKMSRIVSPIPTKNIAYEFVIHNYRKCSLTDSTLQRNIMLLIDWSNTPVRLFGGAIASKTKDLCGFF